MKVYIKAPWTVSALEARRSAVLPFCATDINSQVRCFLAKRNYRILLAHLETVKGIARLCICVQRYRCAKAAALCLHAIARGFTARCWHKAFVQRCKGGYSRGDSERRRRRRQQAQSKHSEDDHGGSIGNYRGGNSADVIIAPRSTPIPPRLWAPVLQVITLQFEAEFMA